MATKPQFRWTYIVVPLFTVFVLSFSTRIEIPALNEAQSRLFLTVKGVIAALGVVLLLFHMYRESPNMRNLDQRFRYLLLLAYGTLSAYSTTEQIKEDALVTLRHYGGMVLAIGLVLTALYSMSEMKKYRTSLQD